MHVLRNFTLDQTMDFPFQPQIVFWQCSAEAATLGHTGVRGLLERRGQGVLTSVVEVETAAVLRCVREAVR